jgi:predicted nucleic acid-binding protein
MPPPVGTMDSSNVIALDHLELLPQLSLLFSRVLLPKAVRTEFFKRRLTKNRLRAILDSYAFLERCDDYDKGAVDVLLIERATEGREDRGEAEAVVQAAKVGAMVIVDDPWGRRLAARFDCDFHGTVWVLRRFFELGLTSSSTIRNHFIELFRRGTRLPREAVNAFLLEIGEAPLSKLGDLSSPPTRANLPDY